MLLPDCSGLLGDCLLGPGVLGQGSILVVIVSCKQVAADLWSAGLWIAGLWPLFALEVQYWLRDGDHRVAVVAFDCWEVLLPVGTPVVV